MFGKPVAGLYIMQGSETRNFTQQLMAVSGDWKQSEPAKAILP